MATVPQTAAKGATLFGTAPRAVDDTPDRFVGGVYDHNPIDGSATMFAEIVSRLLFLEDPFMQVYACAVGVAVGDPVYASGSVTVAKALATTAPSARVIGFVAYKPTTTTCVVRSAYLAAGAFSGFGVPVYLTDAGGIDDAAGTVIKVLGTAISTTAAIVWADPRSAQEDGPTSELDIYTANSAAFKIKAIEELVTLTGATTPTAANHLLQYRKIIGVAYNVQTLIPNARTFKLGVTGDLALFAAAGTSGALGTKGHMWQVGLDEFLQTEADAPIVITASNADAAGGKIRVTTFYKEITPPQS